MQLVAARDSSNFLPRRLELALGLLLVLLICGGYYLKTRPITGQENLMNAGLDAFYKRGDPAAAVVHFRQVLALNPNHYGATFQLAKALDAAGRAEEARSFWVKVRP